MPLLTSLLRAASDKLTNVVPVPIAQLRSSYLYSDNGGSYQRANETLICGPAWTRDIITQRQHQLVDPPPFGLTRIDDAIVCGEGIILKKRVKDFTAVAETLAHASTHRSILPMKRTAADALQIDKRVGGRHLARKACLCFPAPRL